MKKVTFNKAFEMFIQSLIRYKAKSTTISTYIYLYECHLQDFFGVKNIEEITNKDIDRFVDLKAGLNGNYINLMLSIFNAVIKFVRSEDIANVNSFLQAKQIREQVKKVEIFTEFEKSRIESYCISRIEPVNIAILLSLSTGIRLGELCALQKEDFDFNNNAFKITKTMIRVKNLDKNAKTKTKIVIVTPKSKASIRTLPVPAYLVDFIKELFENAPFEAYITTGKRRFITPRTIENQFTKVLNHCKINYKKFHTLRHTFATYALKSCMDIKTLSEILGHSSVKTTLDRYVQSDFSTKKAQMDILSNQFFENHNLSKMAL